MKRIATLLVVFLGALVVVMAHAGPTYAQQTTVAVTSAGPAVDSVVGAESTVPVQLVRRGAAATLFAVVCGAPASRVVIASGHSYLAGFMVPLSMAATTLVAARDVIKKAIRLAYGTAIITGATSLADEIY